MLECKTKEREIDILTFFTNLWDARMRIIKAVIIGVIAGIIIALSIPQKYTSTAKVVPEQTSKNSMGTVSGIASMFGMGAPVNSDGLGVSLYPEIVKSTPFLLEFADINVVTEEKELTTQIPLHQYMLDEQKKTWWSNIFALPGMAIDGIILLFNGRVPKPTFKNSIALQNDFCVQMSEAVSAKLEEKKGTLTITSTFQDPNIAKIVADSALVKLQRYMTLYHTAKTQSSLKSNVKMMDEACQNYYDADEAYSLSSDRNKNLINKRALIKVERLKEERDLASEIYKQIALQVATDRIKLAEEKPIVTVIEPVNTPLSASSPNRILIIIVFSFLCGMIPAIKVIITTLYVKNSL